jgi:uncharacterized membrane protein
MGNGYLIVKVVHVISVIVWLGGMVMIAGLVTLYIRDANAMRVLGGAMVRVGHVLFMPASILTLVSGITLMFMLGGHPPFWMIWGLVAGPGGSIIGTVVTRKAGMQLGQLMAKPGVTEAELEPWRARMKTSIYANVLLTMSAVVMMVLKPF